MGVVIFSNVNIKVRCQDVIGRYSGDLRFVVHMPVQLIGGLRQLAPRYDGFILDLWGVIHDGVAPIPGAIDCLRC